MRLVLQAHQTAAADLVEQRGLIFAAVDPLFEEILEGLGDLLAALGKLEGLLCILGSELELLVLGSLLERLGSLDGSLLELLDGIFGVLILGGLVVFLQAGIVVVIVGIALRGPCAVRSLDDCLHALTEDTGLGRVAADELVGDDLLAGDDGLTGSDRNVDVVELVAADDAGAVRRGLLDVDDRGVDSGNGHGDDLLAGNHGVLDLSALEILDLGHGLALFFADAPELHEAAALHQAHRQERKTERGSVQHEHQHVLGIVFIGELALLDGSTETTGNVGVAGVGGVAVDVGSHTALADEHIDFAAAGAGINDEVLLTLTQDLADRGVRFAVGGEAADRKSIAILDVLCNGIVQ